MTTKTENEIDIKSLMEVKHGFFGDSNPVTYNKEIVNMRLGNEKFHSASGDFFLFFGSYYSGGRTRDCYKIYVKGKVGLEFNEIDCKNAIIVMRNDMTPSLIRLETSTEYVDKSYFPYDSSYGEVWFIIVPKNTIVKRIDLGKELRHKEQPPKPKGVNL